MVGGVEAEDVYLSTQLIRYYVQNLGLEVHSIKEVTEYARSRPFAGFVKMASDRRREYSDSADTKMLADMYKLVLNASYGSTLLNRNSHNKINIVHGHEKAAAVVNDKRFRDVNEIGGGYHEVVMAPARVKCDLATVIGFQILNLAKLKLGEFVFDWLDKYLIRKCFAGILADTDSYYLALSRDSLEGALKPEMREAYREERYGHCGEEGFEGLMTRLCCPECTRYDLKRPGCYKAEFEGDIVVALCSKTYVAQETGSGHIKLSLKGVNKRKFQNEFPDIKETFLNVLRDKKSVLSKNIGFRMRCNKMITYRQEKVAAGYLYIKRETVGPDGIYTKPLKCVLNPAPIDYICLSSHAPFLALDDTTPFTYSHFHEGACILEATSFKSIRQAYVYMNVLLTSGDVDMCYKVRSSVDGKTLVRFQRKLPLLYKWERAKEDILYSIIESRFCMHRSVMSAALLAHPTDYRIYMNCTTCRLTCTGISPAEFRWRSEQYNAFGRNLVGECYMHIRRRFLSGNI